MRDKMLLLIRIICGWLCIKRLRRWKIGSQIYIFNCGDGRWWRSSSILTLILLDWQWILSNQTFKLSGAGVGTLVYRLSTPSAICNG